VSDTDSRQQQKQTTNNVILPRQKIYTNTINETDEAKIPKYNLQLLNSPDVSPT